MTKLKEVEYFGHKRNETATGFNWQFCVFINISGRKLLSLDILLIKDPLGVKPPAFMREM